MKRLINKKTGEVAIIDLYSNTITFSKSKTTHKITIQKDSSTNKITKITTSSEPIKKSSLKPNNDPISNTTPNPNTAPNTIPTSIPNTNTSLNSNPLEPDFNIIDDYSKYEMIPETELFFSPDPLNPSLFTPTYKKSA
jgi:hypothetical protein